MCFHSDLWLAVDANACRLEERRWLGCFEAEKRPMETHRVALDAEPEIMLQRIMLELFPLQQHVYRFSMEVLQAVLQAAGVQFLMDFVVVSTQSCKLTPTKNFVVD